MALKKPPSNQQIFCSITCNTIFHLFKLVQASTFSKSFLSFKDLLSSFCFASHYFLPLKLPNIKISWYRVLSSLLAMDSRKNSTGPGEVSFSCYLKSSEENFINKLGESSHYPNHSITSSPEFPSSRSLVRTKTAEGEIGVFGAEKYYNMKLEEGPIIIDTSSTHGSYSKRNQVDLLKVKSKSRPGTPSATSEASWNSQNALLPTYQKNMSPSRQKKVQGKSFFAALSCCGSCSNKKSVYINQQVEHGVAACGKESVQITHSPLMLDGRKQQQSRLKVKDEFHFPCSEKLSIPSNKDEFLAIPAAKSAGVQSLAVKKQTAKEKIIEEESRKSLDVFGSHKLNKEVIEVNLERKLSMLTWDAIPKAPNLPITSMRSHVYEDMESDASSDLFEIENISGSNGQPFFTRQTSDGMSSCMTPTRYAPSETSIEWSVVTASAAEFSSAVTDYDEKKLIGENIGTPPLPTSANKVAKTRSMVEKETQGSHPSKFLSCKSIKAVRIAESAYRINEKAKSHHLPQQPQRSVAPMPVRKLPADIDKRF